MSGLLTTAELADITNTVASSLDVSLPQYRPTVTQDTTGHDTYTYPGTPTATIACNIIKPTPAQLQAYADIIGAKRALILRVKNTTDVKELDQFSYDGLMWLVQTILDAESYTVTKKSLMTVIA